MKEDKHVTEREFMSLSIDFDKTTCDSMNDISIAIEFHCGGEIYNAILIGGIKCPNEIDMIRENFNSIKITKRVL